MVLMPNNLNEMIRQANMTKREVAALKGITPENLSRQVNGHTNITLQDAEHYAKILSCTAQDVLFATPPVPIVGYCKIMRCDPGSPDCPDMGVRIEREISAGKTMGKVYLQSYMQTDTAAVIWSSEPNYHGPWEEWKNAVEYVEREPIEKSYVSENAIQHDCYVYLDEPVFEFGIKRRLIAGKLYPEPGGLYTIHNSYTNSQLNGQKLVWASAMISVSFRPKLRGMEIIFND